MKNLESILSVENVNKSFGTRNVLKNINLSLSKGEFVSLVGLSGSGKSTLLNIIAGLEKPDTGDIFLEREIITGKTANVSYMFQKDLLFPYYSILDNVVLPLVIQCTNKNEAIKRAIPYFKTFGLEGTENLYPSELSGGMKQRAALLRTYLFAKKIMLLDEPFSALDMITKNQMHEWYLSIIEKMHLTTLLITHDIEEAILLSDRILVMHNACEKDDTNIVKEIRINQARPRTTDFCFTAEFLELKKEIFSAL